MNPYLFFIFFTIVSLKPFAQQPKLMLPIGHTELVTSASFSPDGKKIVTTSHDYSAKIWDVASGFLIADLKGHTSVVNSASFSPDGKKIVTSSWDRTAKVWDAASGVLIADLKGHTDWVNSASFSPDGKKIVTSSSDHSAKIWDVASGSLIADLNGHTSVVNSASFSPGGKKIVTSSSDHSAKIWDVASGALIADLKGQVNSASFSPDGKKIVTASGDYGFHAFEDCTAKIWDAVSGSLIVDLKGHVSRVNSASFSPDGRKIVTASSDSTAKIWDAEAGSLITELKGHTQNVISASFSSDGKKIVTYSEDNTAKIWDAVSGSLIVDLKGHISRVNSASFSPDGKKIITASNKISKIWDALSGSLIADLKGHSNDVGLASFSTDGKKIVIASGDSTTKVWDAASGILIANFSGHTESVCSTSFSPDGKKIVTTSWDSTAKIWDAASGVLIADLKGHTEDVISASFSPDGKKIVTSSLDGYYKIWDAVSGALIADLKGLKNSFNSASFSPDGKKIVTASGDNTAKVWDAASGILIANLSGHTESVCSTSFSPDGKKIVTSSLDGYSKIWDAVSGALIADLKGLKNSFNSASFSPDGKKIFNVSKYGTVKIWDAVTGALIVDLDLKEQVNSASFSPDGKKIVTTFKTAKIWDATSGVLIADLKGHTAAVNSASFSPDGKKIITASWDNTAKIWDASTGKIYYTILAVDSTDYLVIDTEGRFDGTEGARKLLYYICGDEIIDLEQLKALSWEPGLVSKIMDTNKEPITAKKISEINICNFTPEVEERGFNNGVYQYQITPRNGGVGEIQLYINGKLIKKYNPTALSKKENTYLLSVNQKDIRDYFVSGKDNEVSVKATTKEGTMTSRGVAVTSTALSKAIPVPNMYVVSIGISNYKGEKLKLGYASKDAADFAAVVTTSAKKLLNADGIQHVNTYTFSTETGSQRWPAKSAIQKIMDSIAQKATADDILIIFFAGHGALQTGQKNFYLLTAEAVSFEQVMTVPKEVAISTDELNEWMRNIKANKQLLILDACNSGQVVQNIQELIAKRDVPADQQRALENLKDITGTYILSASAASQPAYETSLYGQGLLTYSLLSGIKLGDGLKDNKYIDVTTWFNTAKALVAALAKDIGGRQDPQIMGNASFAVGLVDKEIADGIKLSIKKKIFRRSNLIKEGIIPSDNLGLTAFVDKELNEVSARGKESPFTYAADNTMLDAYSVLGRYTVNGNNVTVKVYLIKGIEEDNIVNQFEINGTVDKKEELAGKILQVVQQSLKD